ncbi:MAG: glycosyltransferase family 2 protein [Acidobacteria bacterium]|nr:glycosyltransferase family 2 protein [Acidobacteriota bacterium]
MKIAFVNQFRNAAENQAYESLRIAAERIGHQLIHCAGSAEVDACQPDFVLAPASTRPKLNDFPHYGILHDPRETYLHERPFFNNLRTHDGWVALADTMLRFARDIAFSVGRDQDIGVYYNSCQKQTRSAGLEPLLRQRSLRLAYFGTNWDKRRSRMFRTMSFEDNIVIGGPPDAWQDLDPKSYCGELVFDGDSVQAKYAECGAGLCLLSDKHFRDDVISNRVLEIASVGALVISCDTPWLRKHFGDSLYYVDQRLPDPLLLKQILAAREEMYRDPAAALQRAAHARHVFEQHFCGEVLLANAVEHHLRVDARRKHAISGSRQRYWPLISVILRCGSRPIETVRRAVESLARQSYGRFHLILVRHHPLDLSSIEQHPWPNIERIETIECPAGNCSKTLWAGLNAVAGDYFSVLDDDDWLFSNHFEELFRPFPASPQQSFFAFSGSVSIEAEARRALGGSLDNRHVSRFGPHNTDRINQIASCIATNAFVASRDLLHDGLLHDPHMDTAEDTLLILSLLSQTRPIFSHAATCVSEVGHPDRISATAHPRRFEDEFTLHTRLSGKYRPPQAPFDSWSALREEWDNRPAAAALSLNAQGQFVAGDDSFFLSSMPDSQLRTVASGWHYSGSKIHPGCGKLSRFQSNLSLRTKPTPWHYAAELRFRRPRNYSGELLMRVELLVKTGRIGVGLLNRTGPHYLFRAQLRAMEATQVVNIPIDDISKAGQLILQTWDEPALAEVELLGVRLLAARES